MLSGSIQSISAAIPQRFEPSLAIPASTNSLACQGSYTKKDWHGWVVTSPLAAYQKYFGEQGQWPTNFLLWPVMLLKALWYLLHSTWWRTQKIINPCIIWFTFEPTSVPPLKLQSIVRILQCPGQCWIAPIVDPLKLRWSETMSPTKTIHLCHQQMSQCTGPPIQRFRPVNVIPCHQFVFRLKNIPLKTRFNKNNWLSYIYLVCSTLLSSWAEQQARLGVDSDLALVSIYK